MYSSTESGLPVIAPKADDGIAVRRLSLGLGRSPMEAATPTTWNLPARRVDAAAAAAAHGRTHTFWGASANNSRPATDWTAQVRGTEFISGWLAGDLEDPQSEGLLACG